MRRKVLGMTLAEAKILLLMRGYELRKEMRLILETAGASVKALERKLGFSCKTPITRLERRGLVKQVMEGRFWLTEEGRARADSIRSLLTELLSSILGFSARKREDGDSGFEVLKALSLLLKESRESIRVTPREVLKAVKRLNPTTSLNEKRVGWMLKKLGFRRLRIHGSRVYAVDKKALADVLACLS